MEMKTYSCVLVSKRNSKHETPLTGVTKQELQLLAFIHGVESLPVERIKPLGSKRIVLTKDAAGDITYVTSEKDEYHRLAAKYETRVNPGRGKKYVEDCFKTTIGGFDHIITEIDALTAMEQATEAAEKAEAEKVINAGGAARTEAEERAADGTSPSVTGAAIGSKLFDGFNRASP